MRPLTLDDLLPASEFLIRRPALEQKVIAAKEARRLELGPHMALVFENHLTIQWQVQEMCRVERITRPEAIQDELAAYNPLLPGPSELSGTLLVAYNDPRERAEKLRALSGLSRHMLLHIEGEAPAPLCFDGGREEAETGKISSVQYVRIPLTDTQRRAFLDLSRGASVVVDHPAYSAQTSLRATVRGALVEDLLAE